MGVVGDAMKRDAAALGVAWSVVAGTLAVGVVWLYRVAV